MPIHHTIETVRPTQAEFGQIAYEVMSCVYDIHNDQNMRLVAPEVAFKLTSFPDRLEAFEVHARRLLQHTSLQAIHWANITHKYVTFTTIC